MVLRKNAPTASPNLGAASSRPRRHASETISAMPTQPVPIVLNETDLIRTNPPSSGATDVALHDAPTRLLHAIPRPAAEALTTSGVQDLREENTALRSERDELLAQVARLTQESTTLRDIQKQLQREMELLMPWLPEQGASSVNVRRSDLLRLVRLLSESLKKSAQTARSADLEKTRQILGEATSTLAELRKLLGLAA